MIYPGTYRAIEQTTVELCQRTGEKGPRVVEYVTHGAGAEFTIPRTVNGFFHRVMFDREEQKPMGRYERIS